MSSADQLLQASFSWIKMRFCCAEKLRHSAQRHDRLKPTTSSHTCVSISSLISGHRLRWSFTADMKQLQKMERESNKLLQRIREQVCANSSEQVMGQILTAVLKQNGLRDRISVGSASAQRLIEQMSKTKFQEILEGRSVAAGGVGVLEFAEIRRWTELIQSGSVTEALKSVRETADRIFDFSWALLTELNNTERVLEEMVKQEHEEQLAREKLDVSVSFKHSTTDPPRDQNTCAEPQIDQRHEDEQEGPSPGGGGGQNEQPGGDQQGGADYQESSSPEKMSDETYYPSPSEISDPEERWLYCRMHLTPPEPTTTGREPRWALLNIRSLKARLIENWDIGYFLRNLDVLILTETWLKRETAAQVLEQTLPQNYKFSSWEREDGRRGGGVAIIYLESLNGAQIAFNPTATFEHVATDLVLGSTRIRVIAVYHLTDHNNMEFENFLHELDTLLSEAFQGCNSIILAGDFNIWMDVDKKRSADFRHFLENRDLIQYVRGPTHVKNHTLDLVISSRNVQISDVLISESDDRSQKVKKSDHYTVYFNVRPLSQDSEETRADEDEDEQPKRFKSSEE